MEEGSSSWRVCEHRPALRLCEYSATQTALPTLACYSQKNSTENFPFVNKKTKSPNVKVVHKVIGGIVKSGKRTNSDRLFKNVI